MDTIKIQSQKRKELMLPGDYNENPQMKLLFGVVGIR
jgi:hypothetical protein